MIECSTYSMLCIFEFCFLSFKQFAFMNYILSMVAWVVSIMLRECIHIKIVSNMCYVKFIWVMCPTRELGASQIGIKYQCLNNRPHWAKDLYEFEKFTGEYFHSALNLGKFIKWEWNPQNFKQIEENFALKIVEEMIDYIDLQVL